MNITEKNISNIAQGYLMWLESKIGLDVQDWKLSIYREKAKKGIIKYHQYYISDSFRGDIYSIIIQLQNRLLEVSEGKENFIEHWLRILMEEGEYDEDEMDTKPYECEIVEEIYEELTEMIKMSDTVWFEQI